MHFCGRYRDSSPYGRPESKAFSSRTVLKIISKIGTYSYCTPLLICVGGCTTVLVVWLPIILFECVAQLVEHRTVNRVVDGFKSLHAHSLLLFSRK